MEIPEGVLLSFCYCILGLILGLLVGTDYGLIVWSMEQKHSVEWVSAYVYSGDFESDFVKLLITQISAVKFCHIPG